jgi:hypothetical protein
MIDALRFGMTAAVKVVDDESPMAHRQRASLVTYLSATVNEIEDWRKTNRAIVDSFPPLAAGYAALDAIDVAPYLRAAMGRLRNKVIFHFDIEPFHRVVGCLPDEELTLSTGVGNGVLADSNDLADMSMSLFALDAGVDHAELHGRHMALLNAALDRANAFATTTRDSLHAFLVANGATFS